MTTQHTTTGAANTTAARLEQLAADAFVTWRDCAGHTKAELSWSAYRHACDELNKLGLQAPSESWLRLKGRFNGDGTI
jgi:hypothetical protein